MPIFLDVRILRGIEAILQLAVQLAAGGRAESAGRGGRP